MAPYTATYFKKGKFPDGKGRQRSLNPHTNVSEKDLKEDNLDFAYKVD